MTGSRVHDWYQMEGITRGEQDGEEGPETPRSNLGHDNQIVMVLCMLRLGLQQEFVSRQIGVPRSTVSDTFHLIFLFDLTLEQLCTT